MSAVPNLPESVLKRKLDGVDEAAVNTQATSKRLDHPNGAHTNGINGPHVNGTYMTHSTNGTSSTQGFTIPEKPIENPRPIRVIVIGAGISGILAGIRIPERIPNVSLAIYEKNSGIGGTWHENKYLGCACDIPSHSYQYSFAPNTQWSALYASSHEIEKYLVDVCKKFHADRFIHLQHQVEACRWDAASGKWRVRVRNNATDQVIDDEAEVVISARGGLNNFAWPAIPGLDSFSGKLMHSARWDEAYDCSNQRVGIIGNGSSGIQILPRIQALPNTKVTSFARSPTWISPPFGTQNIFEKAGIQGVQISDDIRQKFRDDPEYYQRFRVEVEEDQVQVHSATLLGTPMQTGGKEAFEQHMSQRLASKPDILRTLKPNFPPGCRRLTPGPGYLEALTKENVDFVSTDIDGVEANGVRTVDGTLHELDVLVCATGFKTDFKPPFKISGKEGESLTDHWMEYPRSYLSVATDNFPNMFFILGPNAAIGAGSLTMMIEAEMDYATKCVRKLQKENIRSMSIKPARVDDFVEYCDEYFKRTVYSTDCKSWYKNKQGRVSGLWPGSTLTCLEAMRSPRWEDYVYEYEGEEKGKRVNQLAWLGNGWSINMLEDYHKAWYLYPEFVDVPEEFPEKNKRNTMRMWSH